MWTELCRKNVEHSNDHPVSHNAATAVLTVGAVVVMNAITRAITRNQSTI
jgi:hypothetical protein